MRRLTETDRERILEYINKEPELNLFFSSNIEKYGFRSESVCVYAEGSDVQWECLLLKYYDDYTVYSQKENLPLEEIMDFFCGRQVDCIRGKIAQVKLFQRFYPERVLKENNLCRFERTAWEQNRKQSENSINDKRVSVKRLYASDTSEMMRVYLSAEEFARTFRYPEKSEQKMKAELESGEIAVGICEGDRLVSVARTSGSTAQGAMVVCVATNPRFRQKGYGSFAVQALCDAAFGEGKQFLCLFYSNPTAGRIYERIGFQVIGDYAMLR